MALRGPPVTRPRPWGAPARNHPSLPARGGHLVAAVIVATLAVTLTASVAAADTTVKRRPPSDPFLEHQWALDVIGASDAWSQATGRGTRIAVVDTGVDLDHEDLAGKVRGHVSCIGAGGDPTRCAGSGEDDHGHGTHVAGIAAAATFNDRGVAGVAPDAEILAVRVLEADGTGNARGSAGDVAAGVRWATQAGASVINLSLSENVVISGLLGSSPKDAINDAWKHGVITVVAAGNTENDEPLLPSAYRDVDAIVVTATNRSDAQAGYAADVENARWGMAAPGGALEPAGSQILSTWWDDETTNVYAWAVGTSMAAPHVAGAAAMVRSLGLSPAQTVERLLTSAMDIGEPGVDRATGHGRLDLRAATLWAPGEPRAQEVTTTTRAPNDGPPRGSARASATPTTSIGAPAPNNPASENEEPRAPAGGTGRPNDARVTDGPASSVGPPTARAAPEGDPPEGETPVDPQPAGQDRGSPGDASGRAVLVVTLILVGGPVLLAILRRRPGVDAGPPEGHRP